MKQHSSHSHMQDEHVVDLLPAYINGTLDTASSQRVRAHLAICDACGAELASWEAIRHSTKLATAAQPLPSMKLFKQAWQKIEALEVENARQSQVSRRSLQSWLRHLALVFRRQVPLIHKSIWIASALINVLVLGLVFISLALSVTLGSVFGVAASLTIEVFQAVSDSFTQAAPFLHFLRLRSWQATPLTLLVALALMAFAIYYAPRQPRLSQA